MSESNTSTPVILYVSISGSNKHCLWINDASVSDRGDLENSAAEIAAEYNTTVIKYIVDSKDLSADWNWDEVKKLVDDRLAALAKKSVTFFSRAYSTGELCGPDWAQFEVTDAWLKSLEAKMSLVKTHGMSEARFYDSPTWGPGDIESDLRLQCGELVIMPHGSFWFTDRPKHHNDKIETPALDFTELRNAFDAAEDNGYVFLGGDLAQELKDTISITHIGVYALIQNGDNELNREYRFLICGGESETFDPIVAELLADEPDVRIISTFTQIHTTDENVIGNGQMLDVQIDGSFSNGELVYANIAEAIKATDFDLWARST